MSKKKLDTAKVAQSLPPERLCMACFKYTAIEPKVVCDACAAEDAHNRRDGGITRERGYRDPVALGDC